MLSACETGFGEDGGGEGVYGLQRAFHVAGCRNVLAALGKVDDGATQALMTLFYRNLWEKKMDDAEALRQAQLTLYRHPEAVTLAQQRGVDFTESDLPQVEEKPVEKPKRSPTAHGAAFTFSGVWPMDGIASPQVAERLKVPVHWLHDRIHNGTIQVKKHRIWKRYLFPDTPKTLAQLSQLRDGKVQQLRF